MNIFSLNIKSRRVPGPISRPEVLYSCKTQAKPILHDTMLQLNVVREIQMVNGLSNDGESFLLEGENEEDDLPDKVLYQ